MFNGKLVSKLSKKVDDILMMMEDSKREHQLTADQLTELFRRDVYRGNSVDSLRRFLAETDDNLRLLMDYVGVEIRNQPERKVIQKKTKKRGADNV